MGIAGPATRAFCHPEAFRNCVLVAWGRSTQRRRFFFLNEKKPPENTLEAEFACFFVFFFVVCFGFQCDMKKNGCFGVFFWGGERLGGMGMRVFVLLVGFI